MTYRSSIRNVFVYRTPRTIHKAPARRRLTLETLEGRLLLTSPPTVVTGTAALVSASQETLSATVNPNGSSTTARFQYSTDPSFTPTDQTTLGAGLNWPSFNFPIGVAVDAAGDVFVGDNNNAVKEIPPDHTTAPSQIGTNAFTLNPYGVAVDSKNNVYVALFGNNYVGKLAPPYNNGNYINVFTDQGGVGTTPAEGVAVDAHDNVFVADTGINAVFGPNGSVGSGFNHPVGVAVDAAGDVFVADQGNNAVKEVLPNGTIKTIGSGFNQPAGVAVDAAGNVFVADTYNNAVKEVLPNGTIETIGSGFNHPWGVAVDAAGNVFVADSGNNRIVELSPPTVFATPRPLTGTTPTAVSATLSGLTPGTTYYYRAVASSAGGTVADRSVHSFSTPPPPTIASNLAQLTVNKGAQATNTGIFHDAQGNSTVTLTASLGTVTKNDAAGTWSWAYTPSTGPAVATVTITATDNLRLTAITNFPLTVYTHASSAKFVQALYRYELGRNADPAGLAGWTGALGGTGGQAVVVSGIVNSAEARNRLVGIWYQTYLGRSATSSEISTSATLLASQTEEQVLSQILGGTEYFNRAQTRGFGGTPDQSFVTALLRDLLNRAPVSSELGAYVNTLPTKGTQGVALILLKSTEYRRIVVGGYYTNLLGRTGSSAIPGPNDGWVASSFDLRTIRQYFEASQEFFIHNATLPPTITSFSVPTAGNEGSPVTLSTTATNPAGPSSSYPLTYTWTVTPPAGAGGIITLTGATASFIPPDEGSYGVRLSVTDEDGFSVSRTTTDAIANVAPTPALSGYGTGLATQALSYTASATDPSTTDVAGFTYSINWGDGSANSTSAPAPGNGSGVSFTHVFPTAGAYTVALTATDEDGGATTVNRTVTVLAVTSANMQTVINQQGSITLQETTNTQEQTVVTAVNGLAAQTQPVTVTMNLGSGSFTDTSGSPKAGITLVISGSGGTTTIVGHSPALDVAGGNVIVENLTLVTDTDSPTLVISAGTVTLRNVVIQGTSTGNQPALEITGGNVDLGTADDPGGNTFIADGQRDLIYNVGPNGVSAVGDTWQVGGTTLTSPYRIKDAIFDALNEGGGGLVTYVPGNDYISVNGGIIQLGVDAIAAGGSVNVEAGGKYKKYDAGSKPVTVAFQNGPILTQEADSLSPSLLTLVVTGTPGNDKILFNPGGGTASTVKIVVNDLPQGTFSPNGRLIAHGGAGDDDIQVAGGVTLPAWLYGGDGNDWLKGGGGNNVLVGGAGDDTLIGGGRQNLLIGGSGANTLNAGSGDDLLIAGTTAFDANDRALAAIMAEWTSGRSYASRVANLSRTGTGPRNNGNYFLTVSGPNATVFDDNSVDVLNGGSGMGWFFASLVKDVIHGRRDAEIVESL